jgi:hypothetical protein
LYGRLGTGFTFQPVGPSGDYRRTHPEDESFAVQAFHLDHGKPMPTPRDLLLLTHAARFAALHSHRIGRPQGCKSDCFIEYPTSSMEDAVVIG